MLEGNVIALLAARDHVNVFTYDGGIVPDPDGIVTGGQGNETGRVIAFRQGEPINRARPARLPAPVIANNRAGGWRKLKAGGGGSSGP